MEAVRTPPRFVMNILNGGAHASNCKESLRRYAEAFHTPKVILKHNKIPVPGVGDEGGCVPMLKMGEDGLSLMLRLSKEPNEDQ